MEFQKGDKVRYDDLTTDEFVYVGVVDRNYGDGTYGLLTDPAHATAVYAIRSAVKPL